MRRTLLGLSFVLPLPAAAQAPPPGGPPPAVGYATVEKGRVAPILEFIGRVQAVDKVEIRARVPGFLKAQEAGDGQEVEVGDLLFLLEPDTYAAQVEQAEADLSAAKAASSNSQAQLNRTEYLAERDVASRALLDQRRAESEQATATVAQAEAALKQARINLGYTRITAPIVGRLGQAAFSQGAFVGPDSGALITLVSQDPMEVVFPVAERQLLEIRRRAAERGLKSLEIEVRLVLSDGSEYPRPGKVDFTDVSVDTGTDTVDVRAVFANPERLLTDGSFVRIRTTDSEPKEALLVPQRAVLNDQQGAYVFVLTPQSTTEQRRITVGESEGGKVIVTEGLQEGERIIVDGVQKVRPGMKVDAAPSGADD